MQLATSSINLEELAREEAGYADEEAAWRNRQQLRALYFAEEDNELDAMASTSRVYPVMEDEIEAPWPYAKPMPQIRKSESWERLAIQGLVARWRPIEI